ncbi:MAG: DUF2784 domain-containing protein [Rhodocyclaceae bacterium]|nr:DUF2784 domain-containing protein [Rhodocyclaceae bacterium]
MFQHLADTVLLCHFAVVLFIVGGLAAIALGNARGWKFVNAPTFRWAHVAAIAVVVVQSWLGVECPLTTLENWLRAQAGGPEYRSRFIEHWVSRLLFFAAPAWVFVTLYSLFGLAVLAAWLRWPPRAPRQK